MKTWLMIDLTRKFQKPFRYFVNQSNVSLSLTNCCLYQVLKRKTN